MAKPKIDIRFRLQQADENTWLEKLDDDIAEALNIPRRQKPTPKYTTDYNFTVSFLENYHLDSGENPQFGLDWIMGKVNGDI